jgi:hypothetical protein
MTEEADLAAQYRKHAKALRAAAIFDKEAKTSILLKRIASDYDHMAHALEDIDRTNKGAPKRP